MHGADRLQRRDGQRRAAVAEAADDQSGYAGAQPDAGGGAGDGVGDAGGGRCVAEQPVDAARLEEELGAVLQRVVQIDLGHDGIDAHLQRDDVDPVQHLGDLVILMLGAIDQHGAVLGVGDDAHVARAAGSAATAAGAVEAAEQRVGRSAAAAGRGNAGGTGTGAAAGHAAAGAAAAAAETAAQAAGAAAATEAAATQAAAAAPAATRLIAAELAVLRQLARRARLDGDVVRRESLLQQVGGVAGVAVLQVIDVPAAHGVAPVAVDELEQTARVADVARLRRYHEHRVDPAHRDHPHDLGQRLVLAAQGLLQGRGHVLGGAALDRQQRVGLVGQHIDVEGGDQAGQGAAHAGISGDQQCIARRHRGDPAAAADEGLQRLGQIVGIGIAQRHHRRAADG